MNGDFKSELDAIMYVENCLLQLENSFDEVLNNASMPLLAGGTVYDWRSYDAAERLLVPKIEAASIFINNKEYADLAKKTISAIERCVSVIRESEEMASVKALSGLKNTLESYLISIYFKQGYSAQETS